jgi:hypothetical protein
MSQLTSKIALYDGTASFFSLDANIINGVLCNALSDPTYLTFRVFFDFNQPSGLLASEVDKYSERSVQNCALAYLKRIGDIKRYEELKKFIVLLRSIQESAFHCFESCSGLKDAWSRQMKDVVVKDKALEFKLTESVDWRFTTLWSLLRHVLFDYERMVNVLPVNLRTFNMTVYVTELRVFAENSFVEDAASKKITDYDETNANIFGIAASSFGANTAVLYNQSQTNKERLKNIYKITGGLTASDGWASTRDVDVRIEQGMYAMFGFSNCEFDMSSANSEFFGDINKTSDPSMASSNIKVKWSNCVVEERLPIVGGVLSDFVVENDSIDAQSSTNSQLQQHDDEIAERLSMDAFGLSDELIEDAGGGVQSTLGKLDVEGKLSLKTIVKQVVKQAAKQVVEFAKDTLSEYANAAVLDAKALAKQQASRLAGKALGSAYGFNAAQLYALTNPQFALSKSIAGIKNAVSSNDPLSLKDVKSLFDAQGGAFEKSPSQSSSGSIPSKSVYQTSNDKKTVKKLGSAFQKDSM